MEQEDKKLLLQDLCSRLPYGIKVNEDIQGDFTLIGLTKERVFTTCEVEGCHNDFPIELIKPYLLPLSSMTKEQREEALPLLNNCDYYDIEGTIKSLDNHPIQFFDWCDKNHFDYRGLIPMGLAIDATDKNIY
jgi:hypothetical protein